MKKTFSASLLGNKKFQELNSSTAVARAVLQKDEDALNALVTSCYKGEYGAATPMDIVSRLGCPAGGSDRQRNMRAQLLRKFKRKFANLEKQEGKGVQSGNRKLRKRGRLPLLSPGSSEANIRNALLTNLDRGSNVRLTTRDIITNEVNATRIRRGDAPMLKSERLTDKQIRRMARKYGMVNRKFQVDTDSRQAAILNAANRVSLIGVLLHYERKWGELNLHTTFNIDGVTCAANQFRGGNQFAALKNEKGVLKAKLKSNSATWRKAFYQVGFKTLFTSVASGAMLPTVLVFKAPVEKPVFVWLKGLGVDFRNQFR